jgi:chromosomal replication initiator protein
VNEPDHLWTAAAQLVRAQVSEAVWLSTLQEVRAVASPDGGIELLVPSGTVRERIATRYLPLVEEAFLEIGFDGDLQITVDPLPSIDESTQSPAGTNHMSLESEGADEPAAATNADEPTDHGALAAGLNPRYTFDAFVKGASNQFALAAALRVAETPGRSYNPLFIHGAAGLGKTHLLHAIGHYVHQNYGHYEVRYVSTETFLNQYVDAIRTNSTAMFKRRYREIDVLLIDDIQFLEGKEGLQEEFFHTFNSLHGASRQIVISSDRSPDNIATLEERLRSRFNWGLTTDIQPPDLETRLAILRNKAERDRTRVPNEVLEFIARNITTNIRELEGALIRVTAYASLNHTPATLPMAEQLLAHLLHESSPQVVHPQRIIEVVSEFYKQPIEALRGKSRQRPLVIARQVAMYVMRELTDLSYPAIAREFGGRDHTTVIHAVEKVQQLMKERHQVYDQVTVLVERFKSGA